eukprot:45132-Eustigmatos_ZCMA.PRE.1
MGTRKYSGADRGPVGCCPPSSLAVNSCSPCSRRSGRMSGVMTPASATASCVKPCRSSMVRYDCAFTIN